MGKNIDKMAQGLNLMIEADPGLARKGLRAERLHPDADENAGGENGFWVVRDKAGREYKRGPAPLIAAWVAE